MKPRDIRQKVLRSFGQAVRDRRIELCLSQEKLAELADLHRTYVADIERGTRNVGLLNIVRLGDALGVPPGRLLEGLDNMGTPPILNDITEMTSE